MLVAVLAFTQQGVTFDVPADRLPNVLAAMEKATAVHLECTAAMAREVVVMHVENRPRDEVMAQFATALDADWVPLDTGGYRLTRSTERNKALRDAQAAREAAAYAEWIEKAEVGPFDADRLAKKMKGIAQSFQPRKSMDANLRANQEGPAYRALIRALKTVGSRALAAVPVGGRVVYATRPTPAQRPLNSPALLSNYSAELNAWVDSAKRNGVQTPKVGGNTIIPPGLLSKLTRRESPARVLLELARHGRGASVAVHLTFVDDQGRIMDRASASPGLAYQPEKGKIPLDVSPEAEAIGGFFVSEKVDQPLPDDLRARLADAVTNEPLRLLPGDLLPKIAKRRKASLIAALSDDMFLIGAIRPTAGKWTEEEYLHRLSHDGFEFKESEGWVLGRQTDPARRDAIVARGVLNEFNRLPLGESLDVAADWAARLPMYLDNSLPFNLRSLVQGKSDPTFYSNDPRTLRFYGSLSRDQRKAAREGLSLGTLNSVQRERLQPLLGLIGKLTVDRKAPEDREDDHGGDGNILGEPTEALPYGIPRDGVLVVEGSQRTVVFAAQLGSKFPPMAYSAREFADMEMMADMMRRSGYATYDPQSLQAGDRESLNLRFRLTSTVSAQRPLNATQIRSTRGDFASLPEAFRQEVERLRARYRATQPANPGTPPPLRSLDSSRAGLQVGLSH